MSSLTVELMGGKRRRPRAAGRWQSRFGKIADRLVAAHGTPSLGNFEDPVKEIFYILLSAKTADAQYRRTFAALTEQFPTLRDVAEADAAKIKKSIFEGGFATAKADRLKRIATSLLTLGDDPAAALRRMTPTEVYSFLTNLPGVGPKSALCVMMCSLNCDVFPVDVNVSRIAVRIGAAQPGKRHWHYQGHLPPLVPNGRSKELHVAMVVHGRTVCLPARPKCESCQIKDLCDYGSSKTPRSLPNVGRDRRPRVQRLAEEAQVRLMPD